MGGGGGWGGAGGAGAQGVGAVHLPAAARAPLGDTPHHHHQRVAVAAGPARRRPARPASPPGHGPAAPGGPAARRPVARQGPEVSHSVARFLRPAAVCRIGRLVGGGGGRDARPAGRRGGLTRTGRVRWRWWRASWAPTWSRACSNPPPPPSHTHTLAMHMRMHKDSPSLPPPHPWASAFTRRDSPAPATDGRGAYLT